MKEDIIKLHYFCFVFAIFFRSDSKIKYFASVLLYLNNGHLSKIRSKQSNDKRTKKTKKTSSKHKPRHKYNRNK